MVMFGNIGTFLFGALLLLLGIDALVKGITAGVARRASAGFAIVLAATALNALLPAAFVAGAAAWRGQPALALGSIVGGAVAQLGLALGLAAVIAPLVVRLKVFAQINPALLIAIVLVAALAFDRHIDSLDGAILLAAFAVVVIVVVRTARSERVAARALFSETLPNVAVPLLLVRMAVGVALAGYGSWCLVAGSIGMAGQAGWNPMIVGLLALGAVTALAGAPAAISNARRGRGDFAVGQALLGALCNLLLLLGAYALWQPLAPALVRFELPALFALALAVYPMMRSDGELSRREGLVLLGAYALFIIAELWLTSA